MRWAVDMTAAWWFVGWVANASEKAESKQERSCLHRQLWLWCSCQMTDISFIPSVDLNSSTG